MYSLSTIKKNPLQYATILFLIISIVYYLKRWYDCRQKQRSGFKHIGQDSYRSEPSEECLESPGYRSCVLSDGSSGVCGTSGMCIANMLNDYVENDEEKHCTQPSSYKGCNRFCKCLSLSGERKPGCEKECRSWFSPINN